MSIWVGFAVVALIGVLFDRAVMTIAGSRQSGPVRMLLIAMANNAIVGSVLLVGAVADMAGPWLVGLFVVGYVTTNVMMVWRVVQDG